MVYRGKKRKPEETEQEGSSATKMARVPDTDADVTPEPHGSSMVGGSGTLAAAASEGPAQINPFAQPKAVPWFCGTSNRVPRPECAVSASSSSQSTGSISRDQPLVLRQDIPVSITVPGWVVHKMTREGLLLVLFKSTDKDILKRFCSSHQGDGVGPPADLQECFVRIKGTSFVEYLQSNMNGLVARAHGLQEGDDAALALEGTTYTVDKSNEGTIRAAVNLLLHPGQLSQRKCDACEEAGDFILSCCSSVLCSRCLADQYRKKHPVVPTGKDCQGKGAIGVLEQSRDVITSRTDQGLICTSQLALTVEAEGVGGRGQRFDVFVFRKMESLDTIWLRKEMALSNKNARCTVYHMDHIGNLHLVHRFDRHLSFLH